MSFHLPRVVCLCRHLLGIKCVCVCVLKVSYIAPARTIKSQQGKENYLFEPLQSGYGQCCEGLQSGCESLNFNKSNTISALILSFGAVPNTDSFEG